MQQWVQPRTKEEAPSGRGAAVGMAVLLGAAAVAPMVAASAAMWLHSKLQVSTLLAPPPHHNARKQLMGDHPFALGERERAASAASVPAPPSPPHACEAHSSSPQHAAAVRRATAALEVIPGAHPARVPYWAQARP